MSNLNLYGFNFCDLKDFEVYNVRQRVATAVLSDFLRLGYDRELCYQYFLRFVSGFLSVNECVTLIKYRDNLLRDCGTAFPEYDSEEIIDVFTVDSFEISLDPRRYMEVPICSSYLPEPSLFGN